MKDNYDAWKINEEEFPKNKNIEEQIKFFVRYGILAPSTHNTQPWKFKISNNVLTISPDWNLSLPSADPDDNNIFISLGCCLENIINAASRFAFSTDITVPQIPKKNTYIQITFKKNEKKVDKEIGKLFPFITKRYSNKLTYQKSEVQDKILNTLKNISMQSVKIFLIDKQDLINQASLLHEKAVLNIVKNQSFRNELTMWIRNNNTEQYDGMPGFVMGMRPLQVIIGRFLIRNTSKIFAILTKKDVKLITGSPVVGFIASENNSVVAWINAGRLYERLALTAASYRINSTIMDAIIQDNYSRKEAAKIFSLHEFQPQLFFRMGYSNNQPYHTPRRPLSHSLNI